MLDSGITVLRRLNRSEYNNTVRDLLGTSLHPADGLPGDATVDGFDTVGDGLTLSLAHLELLEQAASQLVDELYALPQGDRRSAVLVCQPQAGAERDCARQILSKFARRAFRRPVTEAEVTRLLDLADKLKAAGNTYEEGLKAALRAVLISPNFLFMVEKGTAVAPGTVSPLSDHEVATRLSYFLWSSMPDAALFTAAEAGGLASDPVKLAEQAQRMLKDGKAQAFTKNFVGQWLTLRRLALLEPDKTVFPTYDVTLRDAAVRETELFFDSLMTSNAPIETLLTADFTFANARLGKHYGIAATGNDFQRVNLAATQRVGLLTQSSYLMANAHPGFTSPTKRGAWVLEQLLCAPPPPVPADLTVPPLTEPTAGQTVRQKLEAHRASPNCAGCHAVMDPIGLALENFDAIGAYRTLDNGVAIDTHGTLLGVDINNARELSTVLANDARLQSCFAQHLLTYAVGRSFDTPTGHSYADALAKITRAAGRRGVHDLVDTVIQSEAFRTRRAQ